MTTNSTKTKGSIIISPGAFKGAKAQNNYYAGGTMDLKDQTTVVVSQTVYNDLKESGASKISADGGNS